MITVYSKPNCPYCVKAKALLEQHGVEYREVNVVEDEDALAFLKDRGHKSVPQIYFEDSLVVEGGYHGLEKLTEEEIKAL